MKLAKTFAYCMMVAFVGCGASRDSAPAAQSPASPSEPGASRQEAAPTTVAPAPPSSNKSPSGGIANDSTVALPWEALQAAKIQLDESSDCFSACRALRSMDRSAGRVCELTREGSHCEEAKGAVVRARTKVKGTCRTCPDGTSTDERGPTPAP